MPLHCHCHSVARSSTLCLVDETNNNCSMENCQACAVFAIVLSPALLHWISQMNDTCNILYSCNVMASISDCVCVMICCAKVCNKMCNISITFMEHCNNDCITNLSSLLTAIHLDKTIEQYFQVLCSAIIYVQYLTVQTSFGKHSTVCSSCTNDPNDPVLPDYPAQGLDSKCT